MTMPSLLIARSDWPNSIDTLAVAVFVAMIFLLPVLGYWLTALDVRAWLRALRGSLVKVAEYAAEMPSWVYQDTPPCLRALGLTWPCSEQEVKEAYRRLAERLHPDRGGDIRRFLLLQQQLERSLHYLRHRRPS